MNNHETSLSVTVFGYAPNVLSSFRSNLPKNVSLANLQYADNFGFSVDLLINMLATVRKKLGLQNVVFHLANGYGAELTNETWNGMVGDIVAGKAHFSVPTLVPNPSREKVVGFTYPEFVFSPLCFIVNPKPYISQVNLLSSLHVFAWVGLIALYLLMLVTVVLSAHQNRLPTSKAMHHVYCMSFIQDDKSYRYSYGNAILSLFWSLLVTRTLFIALASTLFYQSQEPIRLPRSYSELPGFMKHYQYKLVLFKGNWFYTQLMTSSDSQFVAIRELLDGDNFEVIRSHVSEDSGSKIVGSLANVPGTISPWDCYVLQDHVKKKRHMVTSEIQNGIMRQALAYDLNLAPYIVNNLTVIGERFRQFGLVTQLERKYRHVNGYVNHSTLRNRPQTLSMITFLNTFLLLAVLLLLCSMTFAIEHYCGRYATFKPKCEPVQRE